MKIELRLFPDSFAELNKITAAIEASGVELCSPIHGMVSNTVSVGEVSASEIYRGDTNTDDDGIEIPEGTLDLPTFRDLTVSTERDSAKRLWCEEINTSNKGTKADMTFKRKPKVDDGYYDHVVSLLDAEASEHEYQLAEIPEADETTSDTGGFVDRAIIIDSPAPAPAPTTAAPAPTTAAPEIVAYMYQGARYEPSQLAQWTPEQIAELAEPIYADGAPAPAPAPAPTPTTASAAPTVTISDIVMRLVQVHKLAPQLKPLIDLGTDNQGLSKPMSDEKRDRLIKALQTVEANAEAFKAGTLTAEQAYGA